MPINWPPLQVVSPDEPPAERLEDLLGEVARGNRAAFEVLYTRIGGPVFGLAHRMLRNAAQAEEVAQEALLQVWREAGRFDHHRGSAIGWVMTIAHGRAVDRIRIEAATTSRQQRHAARELEVPFDSVAEDAELHMERDAVRRCLDSLSDLQREAIMLAYYGGATYREVADRLGVPLGTIKTRIRDGLIRLRACLTCAGVS